MNSSENKLVGAKKRKSYKQSPPRSTPESDDDSSLSMPVVQIVLVDFVKNQKKRSLTPDR